MRVFEKREHLDRRDTKIRTMRWADYVARMGRIKMHIVGKPEGKRPLGRQRRRGRLILKWILER
jgi:hypothetical protein